MRAAGRDRADGRGTGRDGARACVLVREGLGVSLVPESTLPEDRHGLRVMPLRPLIQRVFGRVSSDAGQASRATRLLLDELRGQ
ncbi:hypothetical protein G6F50_017717 [Rhizopus delemar]|uniref:Uncharacterized protein n=1 Tax=Rhizopus delemar TaxID=936053 RepID=A0A9P6XPW4_9FUNG|nr:hypothetical protein G6F50_017717 [Rhizopus delemar]